MSLQGLFCVLSGESPVSSALRFTYILFGIALALLLSVCASESESDTSHLDALVLCRCAPSAVSPDRRRRLCCHPHVPRQAAPGKASGIWACVPAESVQQGRGSLAPASTGPSMAFQWKDTPKGGPGKREWPEHFPLVFGHRRRQASLPEALGFLTPPFFLVWVSGLQGAEAPPSGSACPVEGIGNRQQCLQGGDQRVGPTSS